MRRVKGILCCVSGSYTQIGPAAELGFCLGLAGRGRCRGNSDHGCGHLRCFGKEKKAIRINETEAAHIFRCAPLYFDFYAR